MLPYANLGNAHIHILCLAGFHTCKQKSMLYIGDRMIVLHSVANEVL